MNAPNRSPDKKSKPCGAHSHSLPPVLCFWHCVDLRHTTLDYLIFGCKSRHLTRLKLYGVRSQISLTRNIR